MSEFLRLPLLSTDDVVAARQLTTEVASEFGMATLDQTKLATVVSGLARRTFASSGSGEVVFSVDETPEGGVNLAVAVFDTGTGELALETGNLSRLVDHLEHVTAPDGRHYVTAAVQLPDDAALDPSLHPRLDTLQPGSVHRPAGLPGTASADLLDLLAAQAKELVLVHAEVKRVNTERAATNAELALTNRGVLDLVAELSEVNESLVTSVEGVRQLADQQSALAELGHRAVASRDLELLALGMVGVLRGVLDLKAVGVLRLDTKGPSLDVVASDGCSREQPGSTTVTAAQMRDLHDSRTVVTDPRSEEDDLSLVLTGGARSSAAVAVHTPAGPWGVLIACAVEEGRFTGTTTTFLEAAAALFASSIARIASEVATQHAATHDILTGLPNRMKLFDQLTRLLDDDTAVVEGAPDKPPLAVIFIDIDGFKQVNDTLGHAAGDEVLVAATDRLRKRARPSDVLARLGGDEFVVLCEGDTAQATRIAERLLSAFEEPFDIEGQDMFLSASAGIALADTGATSQQILADADIAMYRAKQTPGAAVAAFHPEMRAVAESQSRMLNELRRAPERGQLRAVYQPIVDLRDGKVRSVEALLRWRHPDLGDVPAEVAVAAAESIGMTWGLTCWIAREASAVVSAWNDANPGHVPLRLAVNVTPLLLEAPSRIAEFAAYVAEGGLPFSLLDIELTETAYVDPTPGNLASLAELRRMGGRLAMDDFGTGYSSLIALSQLPLDVLKVDRSFVSPLEEGGDSLLVSAMILMARGRNLETVGEGIETRGQLATLITVGCDLGQGYLFSRPLEARHLHSLATSEFHFADAVRQARSPAPPGPRAAADPSCTAPPHHPEAPGDEAVVSSRGGAGRRTR